MGILKAKEPMALKEAIAPAKVVMTPTNTLFNVPCSLVTGDPLDREGIIPAEAGKLNGRIMASMPGGLHVQVLAILDRLASLQAVYGKKMRMPG